MRPVAGGRHCASCDRTVTDLVGITEARAMALAIFAGSRGMCGRALADGEGNVIFKRRPRRDRALVVMTVGALATAGCGASQPPAEPVSVARPEPERGPAACDPNDKVLAFAAPASAKTAATSSLDRDGDGIEDDVDQCPDDAGDAGDAANDGCPGQRRIVISTLGGLTILPMVSFAVGRATLGPEVDPLLDEVAATMKSQPDIKRLEIQGHTDSSEGGAAALSKRRAEAVVDALVQRGVERGRLVASGFPATRPMDPDSSAAARERNRRVDFHVVP